MSSRILGLEIKPHLVTGVVVRSGFKAERIESHFEIHLNNQDNFESELSKALKKIADRIDVSDLICQVALPSDWAIYRNIKIPIKGRSKIRQILPYELEPLMAQPIEMFTFDFLPVAFDENENDNCLLATGMERIRLQSCLNLLTEVKMDPDLVTVGSFALAGCISKFIDISEDAALVTTDGKKADIHLLLKGQVAMARSIRLPDGRESGAEIINYSLNQTIFSFEEQYDIEFDLHHILFSPDGGGDHDGVAPAMDKNFDCPITLVNLVKLAGLSMPAAREALPLGQLNNTLALIFARTKGIKTLNFRRGDYGRRLFWAEQRSPLIKTAVLCGVVLLLGILAVILDGYYTRKALHSLDNQVANVFMTTFPNVRRIVDPLQQMKVKIREEKNQVEQLGVNSRKVAVINILNDISKLIPKKLDVILTGITIGPENMVLTGHADQFEMINDMRADLENADWVETAIISSANQDRSGQRVEFKIKLEFDNKT